MSHKFLNSSKSNNKIMYMRLRVDDVFVAAIHFRVERGLRLVRYASDEVHLVIYLSNLDL